MIIKKYALTLVTRRLRKRGREEEEEERERRAVRDAISCKI
jgi:hypothetical protein